MPISRSTSTSHIYLYIDNHIHVHIYIYKQKLPKIAFTWLLIAVIANRSDGTFDVLWSFRQVGPKDQSIDRDIYLSIDRCICICVYV